MTYEENPFEDAEGAKEWIATVENEKGTIRDKEINPKITAWIEEIQPATVLDLGCGQGICSKNISNESIKYIGVDPSEVLINRANELYKSENKTFIVGSVYNLPLESSSVDACFSITVWFHLENLEMASKEMVRVLKPGGKFMIITADPDRYDIWETHYTDIKKEGNKFVGKAKVLLNPDEENHRYSIMSKNTFYTHSLQEIVNPLVNNGLVVDEIEKIGFLPIHEGENIFINILGHKS